MAEPLHQTLRHCPEGLPGSNVIEFPRRYGLQRCNAEPHQAVYLDQAIAILGESECVHDQSKDLLRRALAIRDRLGQ